jgi:hypothetical protein
VISLWHSNQPWHCARHGQQMDAVGVPSPGQPMLGNDILVCAACAYELLLGSIDQRVVAPLGRPIAGQAMSHDVVRQRG